MKYKHREIEREKTLERKRRRQRKKKKKKLREMVGERTVIKRMKERKRRVKGREN